jgi:hypothetical protein
MADHPMMRECCIDRQLSSKGTDVADGIGVRERCVAIGGQLEAYQSIAGILDLRLICAGANDSACLPAGRQTMEYLHDRRAGMARPWCRWKARAGGMRLPASMMEIG